MTSKLLQKYKGVKVVVAIPTTGLWHYKFGRSLINMFVAAYTHRIGEYKTQEILTFNTKGSILTRSRRNCILEARRLNVDYLLFIDSDQTFPRKTLHLLISRNVDVVASNVATKTFPAQPTARNKGATIHDWIRVYTDPESTGLEKVDRIGAGIMLLSRKVIEGLPDDAFDTYYRADVDDVQGEDWSLCESLEEMGIPIYIDHDLSKEVKHVGDFEYGMEHVGEVVQVPVEEEDSDVGDSEPRKTALAQAVG